MRMGFSLLLVSFLPLYCAAQQTSSPIILDNHINAVEQLQSELSSANAQVYASVFDDRATWDGPLGQNAIGPENIERAADLIFRTVGPLQCVLWVQRQASVDTWIVDMYQKATKGHSTSGKDFPTAPGSAAAVRYGGDLRTTLVVKKQDKGWKVIAAWVADLRVSKTNRAINASIPE